MASSRSCNRQGCGTGAENPSNALNYLDMFCMELFRLAAVQHLKDGGQEVVSGRGHAIVAARLGRSVALRRSPLSVATSSPRPSASRPQEIRFSGTFMPQKIRIALDAM